MTDVESTPWKPRCPPVSELVRPLPVGSPDGPTRGQALRGRWRATTHGLYVPSGTDSERVEQHVLEQWMRAGDSGAVTGWAALRLHGAAYFDGRAADGSWLAVQLVGPRQLSRTPHSVGTRRPVGRVEVIQGVRCLPVEQALVDEVVRIGSDREGAVAIDMVCAARLTSTRRLTAFATTLPGRLRTPLLAALALAHEHSASPPQSRMRLVWMIDGGWPEPLCNRLVYALDGRIVGRPDRLDVELGVVGEFDGEHHRSRAQHRRDVSRERSSARWGWSTSPSWRATRRRPNCSGWRAHATGRGPGWRTRGDGPSSRHRAPGSRAT